MRLPDTATRPRSMQLPSRHGEPSGGPTVGLMPRVHKLWTGDRPPRPDQLVCVNAIRKITSADHTIKITVNASSTDRCPRAYVLG